MFCLVSTQAFQKRGPKFLVKTRPCSTTTRLNTVALPPTTNEANTKRKSVPPKNPRRLPLRQVDHLVGVDIIDMHAMEIIPTSETSLVPEHIDDHPFGPKTKLGHHLVDGLFIDALILRTAPLESGHTTGHFILFQAPLASVQEHVHTFATTLKSLPVPTLESVTIIKPITTTLPGFMPLPGSLSSSFISFLTMSHFPSPSFLIPVRSNLCVMNPNLYLNPFILTFSDGFDVRRLIQRQPFKENTANEVGDTAKRTPVVPSNFPGGLPYDEHGAMLQKYAYLLPNVVFYLTLLFTMHGMLMGVFSIMGMAPHHGFF